LYVKESEALTYHLMVSYYGDENESTGFLQTGLICAFEPGEERPLCTLQLSRYFPFEEAAP